ncbi:hypothetical protein AAC387_Pa01g2195 [Persea americana]|eukprot:TRINITY_DN2337_c0_g1_i1.p1 TRINITY_DN2337_c0_g1~~TRINITY_DN2337_c0_g1_i1.p1  ORF type:complete len:707 (-),score=121.69 TRINITY_DN2337_c0_g1_i1:448-2568(-)
MTDLIHDHGTPIDKSKKRVSCKYCCKVVSGFHRLRYHLGGVKGDVVPCLKVPADVQTLMRDGLLEMKKQKLSKEMGQLQYPDMALKRHLSFQSTEVRPGQLESTQPTILGKGKKVLESIPKDGVGKDFFIPRTRVDAQEATACKMVESSRGVLRCIGRFFYDVGIDFGAAKSPYFKKMLDALSDGRTGCRVPGYQELKGWILQEEVKEIQGHVEVVKHSWERTGCSILLDGWTDARGRSLINFMVGCPEGVIYLRSVDATESIGDIDALFSLFDGVIEEVGVKNVVQVITYDTSFVMDAVGKKLMEKHRTIFWTVCAVRCISRILEEIEIMDHVTGVLNKAKTITRFIYSHASILKLMKNHTCGRELVRPSRVKSATPFFTLLNIVLNEENLRNMFNSSTWNSSVWASRTEGKRVAELVRESSFWVGVEEVLKVVDPLVCVLRLIDGGHKPLMGYIYETMDQAKEAIKKNFGGKKARYLPFWNIIDAVWDNNLHSPLHSAGYFLNPSLFYSTDFCADAEVSNGLLCCIVRMVEDQCAHDLIVQQLELYRAALGGFAQEIAIDQRRHTPPALWWLLYGGTCPELQKFAIRILSQTCSGVSSYNMKRNISELLHTGGRNDIEQQKLRDLAFVHYNLRLRHSPSTIDVMGDDIVQEEIDAMDDWIVDMQGLASGNDDLDWMDTVLNDVNTTVKAAGKGSSSIEVKEELQ